MQGEGIMDFGPDVMRMMERILDVCGGILCIYLGYMLFHIASLKQEGTGKFKSAVFEFTATKVGPGVFFALFGAYILYASLNHPIQTTEQSANGEWTGTPPQASSAHIDAVNRLSGLMQNLPAQEDRDAAEAALKNLRTNFSSRTLLGSGRPRIVPDIAKVPEKPQG
jgi:hypothetical protein